MNNFFKNTLINITVFLLLYYFFYSDKQEFPYFFFMLLILCISIDVYRWVTEKKMRDSMLMGFPTEDCMVVLTILFKLRSAELCSIYSTIRDYQKKGVKTANQVNDSTTHWISIFLKDYAEAGIHENESSTYESSDSLRKREKKAAERAKLLVQERFNFDTWPYDACEHECADIQIALLSWSVGFEKMIYELERFRISGLFKRQIEGLIYGYSCLYRRTHNGCFSFLRMGMWNKHVIRTRSRIFKNQLLWKNILHLLESSILLLKIKNEKNPHFDQGQHDLLLQEIYGIKELEQCLNIAICKNSNNGLQIPRGEYETFLFKRLECNPIWLHWSRNFVWSEKNMVQSS